MSPAPATAAQESAADNNPPLSAKQASRMHAEIAEVYARYSRTFDARMHQRLAATFKAHARTAAR